MEILLKRKCGNEIVLYPFRGCLREFTVTYEDHQYYDIGHNVPYLVRSGYPSAQLVFEGFLREPEEPVHISKKYYME